MILIHCTCMSVIQNPPPNLSLHDMSGSWWGWGPLGVLDPDTAHGPGPKQEKIWVLNGLKLILSATNKVLKLDVSFKSFRGILNQLGVTTWHILEMYHDGKRYTHNLDMIVDLFSNMEENALKNYLNFTWHYFQVFYTKLLSLTFSFITWSLKIKFSYYDIFFFDNYNHWYNVSPSRQTATHLQLTVKHFFSLSGRLKISMLKHKT